MCKRRFSVFALSCALLLCSVTPMKVKAQQSVMRDVDYMLLAKLIQTAKENYPRVKQMTHSILAGRAAVSAAQAAWFDVFNFNYLYSPNNSNTLVNPSLLNGYQIGITVNLGSIFQKAPNIRRAKEELYSAEQVKEEFLLSIEANVKQRYFTYIQQLALIRLRTASMTDLEGTVKEVRYKYERGEATLDEYNRAVMAHTEQSAAKIAAETAFLVAKSSLEELLGKPLEEIK